MQDSAECSPLEEATELRLSTVRLVIREVDRWLKRDFDFLGALFILVCTSPFLALLAVMVAMDGGPVFFGHKRVGKNGIIFKCWKFRTMVVGAEECLKQYLDYHPEAAQEWAAAEKLADDPRITPIGRFLRNSCLDEIPQLWNVLIGQMSLVGPRPVTQAEIDQRYGHQAALVTSVRPGVTGAWQVTPNRNDIDYHQRVRLDAAYVEAASLVTDIRIVAQTLPVVMGGKEDTPNTGG